MITFLLGMDEILSSIVTLRESAPWSLQSTLKWFGSKTGGITTWEQHCYWPTGASDVWRLPHHFLLHVVQLPERQTYLQRARRFEQSRNTKCLIMPQWRRAQCPEKWKTRYFVSRRLYVFIFGMKCIVHLGLQHTTINAAKTNFAPLLKSAWHRSTNLRDGMGCFEGRSWFLLFDSAFETSAAGFIWSKEIGQWTEGWFHIERDWKPTNLMLEMSNDLLLNVSPLDLTLAGQSALKIGACSFCTNEREKSCQDFRQLHRDLGQCKWLFETYRHDLSFSTSRVK